MTDPYWQSLLNWTLKNSITDGNRELNPSNFKKMSKEDIEFLTKALESTKEAEKQIEAAIKDSSSFVKGEIELEDSKILKNLELIETYLDDHPQHSLDIAKNEILNTLMKLIEYKNIEIVNLTLRILTSSLGNNEVVAKIAFEKGLFNMLSSRIGTLEDVSSVLSTLSALISSYPTAGKEFNTAEKCQIFSKIFLDNYSERAREKGLLLLYHLVNNKVINMELLNIDNILLSINKYKNVSLQYKETYIDLLLSIVKNYPKNINKTQIIETLDSDVFKSDSNISLEQIESVKAILNKVK